MMTRIILAVTIAAPLFGVVAAPALAQNSESAPAAAAPTKSKPKTPAGGVERACSSLTPSGDDRYLRGADRKFRRIRKASYRFSAGTPQ
jgi:hypothetical protein